MGTDNAGRDVARKVLIGAALGASAAALAALLGLTPFVRTIELKSYDQRMRWTADPARARKDIVIVEIGEDSIRRLEPLVGRWPWPRLVHGMLLDYLSRAPARAIGYDVLFGDRDRRGAFPLGGGTMTGEESDRALAEATARAGNVVLVADATFEGLESGDTPPAGPAPPLPVYPLDTTFEARPDLAPPYSELATAGRALGSNYLVLDPDGPVRRMVPFVRVRDRFVPALGVAVALAAMGVSPGDVRVEGNLLRLGQQSLPLVTAELSPSGQGPGQPRGMSRRAMIHYRGPAVLEDGKTTVYRSYPFYDLLYSEEQLLAGNTPLVDPAEFRDKIVLVGTTAAGLHDVFTSPFGQSGKIPGVQVHAAVVDNVLSGQGLRQAPALVGRATALAGGLIVATGSVLLPLAGGLLVAAATAGLLVWSSVALFARGEWVPLIEPLAAVGLAIFGGVSYQYLVEGREKRKVKRLFSRYVSRDVYDQLLSDPSLARLGGARREMSVLFSDIRGFTTVSEHGQPEAIVEQLNEHFSQMVAVVLRHQGTVDKFVGDMIMALFGAPLDDADHADHAVSAALEMLVELDALNARWRAEGRPALAIGIGINSGTMIAGNIGSETIMSYTVVGDAVNLGSRIESLNKDYGTQLLISGATRERLKGQYDLRSLGNAVVKGKTEPVAIFEVRPASVGNPGVETRHSA